MRRGLILAAVTMLVAGCATLSAPPTMTEWERCNRWGGLYDGNTCKYGSGR